MHPMLRFTVACGAILLGAHGAFAACPVVGGPTQFTQIGDVIFASMNPDPLTAGPGDLNAVEGGWQVSGPRGANQIQNETATVPPTAPESSVPLDCGSTLPPTPPCDGTSIPLGAAADGTWTVVFSSGEIPPSGTQYLHWRIAGKRGVARIDPAYVGPWIFNQHDAQLVNPVGTSIQYSATTPEQSMLPSAPTLPPVFTFNAVEANRTCYYPSYGTHYTQDAFGEQWCNSDREFGDPNEQARVQQRQMETVSAHAEFCTGAGSNLAACLGAWPYVVRKEDESYPEGERYEFYWTNSQLGGIRLHGTIFTPAGVYLNNLNQVVNAPGFQPFPTVVIAGGLVSHQPHYYWAARLLATNGYLVMTYDVSNQGRSNLGPNDFANDENNAVTFVLSRPSNPYPYSVNTPLQHDFPYNPFWKLVDPTRIGVVGHSAGGIASGTNQVTDTRLKTAVVWGICAPSASEPQKIPIMIQSTDFDSGILVPFGANVGQPCYDGMGTRPAKFPRHMLQIRASTHIGWSPGPFYYYNCSHIPIAGHYTLAWLNRYLKGGTPAEMAAEEAKLTSLFDPDPGDGQPAASYYSDQSCTRYDLDADGQSRLLKNTPGSECPATAGQTNSPLTD